MRGKQKVRTNFIGFKCGLRCMYCYNGVLVKVLEITDRWRWFKKDDSPIHLSLHSACLATERTTESSALSPASLNWTLCQRIGWGQNFPFRYAHNFTIDFNWKGPIIVSFTGREIFVKLLTLIHDSLKTVWPTKLPLAKIIFYKQAINNDQSSEEWIGLSTLL